MVVVPFLAEDPRLVARTLDLAAAHPRVAEVIGVHGDDLEVVEAVNALVSGAHSTTIRVLPQKRIGSLRAGKGDAINTGFDYFLASACDRLHFYDADIKTFATSWIEGAEAGLDLGFDTVRHFYPRAPTDGMVTAMLVRPALAMLWPQSVLARIRTPLSGEVAFDRKAVSGIAAESLVRQQSDWGIDTVITGVTARLGFSIYENYLAVGKDHQLYGSLEELATMYWECLRALQLLMSGPDPQHSVHHSDTPATPTTGIADLIAFDVATSIELLGRPLTDRQVGLLRSHFNPELHPALHAQTLDIFATSVWLDILGVLITQADLSDADWQIIAFQLWVARVLHYTAFEVVKGYDHSAAYIEAMIREAMLHPVN